MYMVRAKRNVVMYLLYCDKANVVPGSGRQNPGDAHSKETVISFIAARYKDRPFNEQKNYVLTLNEQCHGEPCWD
jgi:hypothetical protein